MMNYKITLINNYKMTKNVIVNAPSMMDALAKVRKMYSNFWKVINYAVLS